MAITFEQLIAIIETKGANKAKQEVKSVSMEVDALSDLLQHLGTLGGLTYLVSQFRDILSAMGQLSGLGVAAQFQGVAFALESVTRNSASALRIWQQLKDLGGRIGVDPTILGQQAAQMIGLGVPQAAIVPELTRLTDALAFARVNSEDMQSVMFNLLQIRAMGTQKASFADIRQMLTRAPGTATMLSQGLGVQPGQLMETLRGKSMSGTEVYMALMKGAEALAKGAAEARALRDPMFAVASLFLTLRQSMEPTGQIILRIAAPLLRLSRFLADTWKNVNQLTGGLAGMAALVGGALFIATRQATASFWNLTMALLASAGAANKAAVANAGSGAAGVAGALGGAAAGGVMAGIGSRIIGFLGNLLRGLGIAAIVYGASEIAARGMEQSGSDYGAKKMRALGTGASIGGIIGALFGPGGILPGMAIGGAIGLIADFMNDLFPGKKQEASPTDPVAKNTERMAKSLDEIKTQFRAWGGGPRTAAAISDFQTEMQIAKALGI